MTIKTAKTDLECFRCNQIGVPAPQIFKGDEYLESNGICACLDCFERLKEEIELTK